jgi:citrate synthase
MAMLVSAVAALSTFYPDARNHADGDGRRLQIIRFIAKMPTPGAAAPLIRPGLGLAATSTPCGASS